MTDIAASFDTSAARRAMIDSQLRTSGVNEEFALARMLAVPREDFLPDHKAPLAYIDRAVPLGDDGHLAAPLFYGKLLIEAAPMPGDRVLVVEGGTGYLTELLRPLVAETDTMSAAQAAEAPEQSGKSYSLVLIDGAIEQLPEGLAARVEEDGRLVSGLLLRQVTRLASGRKVSGRIALLPIEDLGIPVLHAFDKPKSWSFS
ncbi:protein-L-isoaspartate O-methyltransferase [Erythrobacter sp. JK5]|uniref:protein-L-isoaspartate O-methyltransferase family protein n=1 Tax=Erythrobacter sp. JK5 TaxID=2829500 RepID=UPI001BAD25F6|nr:protein-L-isoaspartate O-methyltransferase [Erythrobacter sp. JK5]QUL37258.1 protein-L-isoaspartate O-methyltransferase [Erythrobacter sp. JK5]